MNMILMYSIIVYITHMRAGCGGWGGVGVKSVDVMFRDATSISCGMCACTCGEGGVCGGVCV